MAITKPLDILAIFAHPGHELRALHTLHQARSGVVYLTDASASTGQSRVSMSEVTLRRSDIDVVPDFMPVADADLYRAMMGGQTQLFTQMVDDIARLIDRCEPDFVLTDSAEGYNPAHDLCHFLVMTAADKSRHHPPVYDIALNHDPLDFAHAAPESCIIHDLDAAAVSRKRVVIEDYTRAAGDMLRREAEGLLRQFGTQGQGREILRPSLTLTVYLRQFSKTPPFFESHGLKRVREGKYTETLTMAHLRPLLNQLQNVSCVS